MRKLGFFSPRIHARSRGTFSGVCVLVFMFLFYNRIDVIRNPLLRESSVLGQGWRGKGYFEGRADYVNVIRRKAVEISDSSFKLANQSGSNDNFGGENPAFCTGLLDHKGFSTECEYLKAHPECSSGGFFDYLKFFYCDCQNFHLFGYAMLAIWLAALFYLLGNTAADYFCCSLEKLSGLLKLAPTVAGVTLLPLGNGAPDVFASIAAFVGTDTGGVGLNSVLGGAVFVTCVVVGTVSLLIAGKGYQIDKRCFIRDISFFLIAIASLLFILVRGEIGVGAAIAFVMIYAIYAFVVAANEILRKHAQRLKLDSFTPLLPVKGSVFSSHGNAADENAVYNPLLDFESESDAPVQPKSVPQWMWASNVAIYSNQAHKTGPDGERPPWGWTEEDVENNNGPKLSFSKLFLIMEFPLTAMRRLTIPMVEEESWSKPYAVASASLSPFLLAFLFATQDNISSVSKIIAYVLGTSIGFGLGLLAYLYTVKDYPPRRFLLPWVLGGFLMSIVWFYMVANELVSLLVAFGVMFGINPSILGLTVLAWGNSMGDLVSNIALALNGEDGVQIALSGCYAGPMFNVLIGLGLSLLIGACSSRPEMYIVPEDSSLFYTIGFLLTGLILAVVLLLKNEMRPTRVLGLALISLYLLFLLVRAGSAMGMLSLVGLALR